MHSLENTISASFRRQHQYVSSRSRSSVSPRRSQASLYFSRLFVSFRSRSSSYKCSAILSSALFSSPAKEEEEGIQRFMNAAKKKSLVPLFHCIFCDHLTPILAYHCLVSGNDRETPSFIFESVDQGLEGATLGRYSVVGAKPAIEVVAKEKIVVIMDHENGKRSEKMVDDPTQILTAMVDRWSPQSVKELPDAFCGGWVGFFSHEHMIRHMGKRKPHLSNGLAIDDGSLPDVHFGMYNSVIVFDHVEKKAYVIHWVRTDSYLSIHKAYEEGKKQLNILLSKVHNLNVPKISTGSVIGLHTEANLHFRTLKKSNMTGEEYKCAVMKAKKHILAGEIAQIVLSQRFERRTLADPFHVYRALRIVNPSPYMAYLQARGCILAASSPAMLIRVKKGKVFLGPLSGTTNRGKTEEEDDKLEEIMRNDDNKCSQHMTLVDLACNDVARVSKPGTVKIEKLMNVERYSNVMHFSSMVGGELLEHLTCWDALAAVLPAGTAVGAPKERAMELLSELETLRRGPYGGGFGSISFSGEMEMAVALRSIVFPTGDAAIEPSNNNGVWNLRREWTARIQAGARIVAGGGADEELECSNKAAALVHAVDLAESAFRTAFL